LQQHCCKAADRQAGEANQAQQDWDKQQAHKAPQREQSQRELEKMRKMLEDAPASTTTPPPNRSRDDSNEV
jgi:hypothetical protein